jgi:hypothetical protein
MCTAAPSYTVPATDTIRGAARCIIPDRTPGAFTCDGIRGGGGATGSVTAGAHSCLEWGGADGIAEVGGGRWDIVDTATATIAGGITDIAPGREPDIVPGIALASGEISTIVRRIGRATYPVLPPNRRTERVQRPKPAPTTCIRIGRATCTGGTTTGTGSSGAVTDGNRAPVVQIDPSWTAAHRLVSAEPHEATTTSAAEAVRAAADGVDGLGTDARVRRGWA